MDAFDFCIIVFLLVMLLLVVGICAYRLWRKLKQCQQRFSVLKKDADALDMEVEALKLFVNKYKTSFPPTIREDIELECQNAAEKSWCASSRKEALSYSLLEERWKVLKKWVNRNF